MTLIQDLIDSNDTQAIPYYREQILKAVEELKASERTIEVLREALTEARDTLNAIACWRTNSAAYTDRFDIPRRKMDEAQVMHIENEAKGPLRLIDTALNGPPKDEERG